MTWQALTWWLDLSYHAAWAVLVVLVVRQVLGPWIPSRRRVWLWALPATRLVLPVLPESWLGAQTTEGALVPGVLPGLEPTLGQLPSPAPALFAVSDVFWYQTPQVKEAMVQALGWLWLAGVAILGLRWMGSYFKAKSLARRAAAVDDATLRTLFEDCRRRLRLAARPDLKMSDEIPGPAVFGLTRPQVILPVQCSTRLNREQLNNVMLHELAHIRRRDLIWHRLALVLTTLHWFNPMMWWALRAFREDLELACDAQVLTCLQPQERSSYGHTLIDLGTRQPEALAVASFAADSKQQLTRRIEMIARFKQGTPLQRAAWILGSGLLVGLTLTQLPLSSLIAAESTMTGEEMAIWVVNRVDDNHQDMSAGAFAQKVADMVKRNKSEVPALVRALQQESEKAVAAGDQELAAKLQGLAAVIGRESSIHPSEVLMPRKQAATLAILRQAGTEMYNHFPGARPQSTGNTEKITGIDWETCPGIEPADLDAIGAQHFLDPFPSRDAWGNPLEYCFDQDVSDHTGQKGHRIGIRSPGSDGVFEDSNYQVGGFDSQETGRDLVWVDGYFATWPVP